VAAAASLIIFVTTSGWAIIATCDESMHRVRVHALGHESFRVRRDRVVLIGDQVSGRDRSPGRHARRLTESGQRAGALCDSHRGRRALGQVGAEHTTEYQDHQAVLRAGDMVIYDSSKPYTVTNTDDTELHYFQIPRSALALPQAAIGQVLGVRIGVDNNPLAALAGPYFASLGCGDILDQHVLEAWQPDPDRPRTTTDRLLTSTGRPHRPSQVSHTKRPPADRSPGELLPCPCSWSDLSGG
jgi:hypothetical protein